jgi:hypothetical protein
MDIKLGEDGDISLVNGDAQTTGIGAEDLAQRLRIRLNTFQGEWFMDNTLGIDWWNRVMGKNRSKMAVDALIQDSILKEPDALQIVSYTSSISSDRKFSCSFRVRTENGAISSAITFVLTPTQ